MKNQKSKSFKLLKKQLSLSYKISSVFISIFLIATILTVGRIVVLTSNEFETITNENIERTIKEIEYELALNNDFLNDVELQLEEKIRTIAKILENDKSAITNDYLTKLCEEVGVSEINYAKADRVIHYSNLKDNLGWAYPETHSCDPLFKGKQSEIIEKVRVSTVDGLLYKYGAVATDDGGIIQVGILADKVNEAKEKYSTNNVIKNIAKRDETIINISYINKDMVIEESIRNSDIGKKVKNENVVTVFETGETIPIFGKDDEQNIRVLEMYIPVKENNETIAVLKIVASMDSYHKFISDIINSSILWTAIFAIVGIGIFLLLIKYITNPLKNLTINSQKIIEGDLTVQNNIKTRDEIGILSKSFNEMAISLKQSVENVRKSCEETLSKSKEIITATKHSLEASEQISMAMNDIARGAETQTETIENSFTLIRNIKSDINDTDDKVGTIVSEAENISKLASQSSTKMQALIDQFGNITNSVSSSVNVILDLNEVSKEIGKIVDIINNIASQTTLLSLNASIEAARAGEAGRGFAVVADEIRKLSEQTTKSADNINSLIKEIQNKTTKALDMIEIGKEETNKGEISVNKMEKALEDVLDSFENIKDMLKNISTKVSNINDNTDEIVKNFEQIQDVAIQSAANTEEVYASVEEQTSNLKEIVSAVEVLDKMTKEIKTSISKYKTDEHECSQETYEWWSEYIKNHEADEQEVMELAKELGIEASEIWERINQNLNCDLGDEHMIIQNVLEEIRKEA